MYVERVAIERRIARSIVDIHGRENAQAVEMFDRGLLRPRSKALPFHVLYGTSPHAGLQRYLLAREEISVARTVEPSGDVAFVFIADGHIDVADVPRSLCDGRALRRRTHLQLHVTGVRHRVGKEGGVGRREVIVAVVAHECFDARLFCHQRRGAESLAAPQQAVLAGARQERIGCGVETFVSNGVEKKEVAGRDVIVDLRFFGISSRHHTIIHLPSKITMVAQHTGSHFGARLRRHVRDEDGGFAKRVEEPFAQ